MSREILLLVDALAHEKSVERDVVYAAVELALASATKKLYPEEAEIRVAIDKDTGETESFRRWLVVPDEAGLQNPDAEEIYSDAVEIDPEVQVGDYIEEAIESVPFGRIGAMAQGRVPFDAKAAADNAAVVEAMSKLHWAAFTEGIAHVGGLSRADITERVSARRSERTTRKTEHLAEERVGRDADGDRVLARRDEIGDDRLAA